MKNNFRGYRISAIDRTFKSSIFGPRSRETSETLPFTAIYSIIAATAAPISPIARDPRDLAYIIRDRYIQKCGETESDIRCLSMNAH